MDVNSYLESIYKYLENGSDQECRALLNTLNDGLIMETDIDKLRHDLSILFGDRGIVYFSQQLVVKPESKIVVESVFKLLNNLMHYKALEFKLYFVKIMNLCDSFIRWRKSTEVQKYAYDILKLIITTPSLPQDIISNIPKFVIEVLKFNSKGQHEVGYQVLKSGLQFVSFAICEYAEHLAQYCKRILRNVLAALETQMSLSNIHHSVIEGDFEVLTSLLSRFSDECSEVPNSYATIYRLVRVYIEKDFRISSGQRAALNLLDKHCSLLFVQMYPDHEWWHNELHKWLKYPNKNDRISAFRVLDALYTQMSQNYADSASIKNIVLKLKDSLEIYSVGSLEFTLAVRGLGKFAELCKRHTDLKNLDLFQILLSKVEFLNSNFENDQIDYLSDYLSALSDIALSLRTNISDSELNVLEKLTVQIIEFYPNISSGYQRNKARIHLIKTIINMAKIGESILESFLEKFVYIGIIKSCMHLLESEIEILKNITGNENSSSYISYKSFLPLWIDLCNIKSIHLDNDFLEVIGPLKQMVSMKVYDKFVEYSLEIIRKLDLSSISDTKEIIIKNRNVSLENDGTVINTDPMIFLNLIDLFTSVIIADKNLEAFEKWIPIFLPFVIGQIFLCTLKSGFYKLLSTIFKISTILKYSYSDAEKKLIIEFLERILPHLHENRNDDLVFCLFMILEVPVTCAQPILPHSSVLFKMVFTIGINNLPLVDKALSALIYWRATVSFEDFQPVLKSVLPFFNTFLQSKSYFGDAEIMNTFESEMLKPILKNEKGKRKYNWNCVVNVNDSTLQNLRKRIIKFLGEVDTETALSLLDGNDAEIWQPTEYLKFKLPLIENTDFTLLYLDALLPRVIDLAVYCGDNKTRITACEVFYVLVTVMIKKSSECTLDRSNSEYELFKKLVRMVFKLGSESNAVVNQLFCPLSLQMIHYYTSFKEKSVFASIILDIIFDEITDDDAVLRDFATKCLLREFVDWSFRQTNRSLQMGTISSNVVNVIERICMFCLHPSSFKRSSGAIAFNHIYALLREEQIVMEVYWLNLLYHFVKNLSISIEADCNMEQTIVALRHIERVLLEKPDWFTKTNKNRLEIKEFGRNTLQDAVVWMIMECKSQNAVCRRELFKLISKLLKISEVGQRVKDLKNSEDVNNFINKFEDNSLNPNYSIPTTYDSSMPDKLVNWLQVFLSGLDCYNWLFDQSLITYRNLSKSRSRLLFAIKYFLSNIAPHQQVLNCIRGINKSGISEDELGFSLKNDFIILKHRCELKLFQLLIRFLESDPEFSASEIFTGNLRNIITSYVFDSSKNSISLITNNDDNDISKILIRLLQTLKTNLEDNFLNFLQQEFISEVKNRYIHFVQSVTRIVTNQVHVSRKQREYLIALIILQESSFLDISQNTSFSGIEIISTIFEKIVQDGKTVSPLKTVMPWLENLVKFSLTEVQCDILMTKLLDNTAIEYKDTNVCTTIGEHFFSLFKYPIVEYLLKHQNDLIVLFFNSNCFTLYKYRIRILNSCLEFGKHSSDTNLEILTSGIFCNWLSVCGWFDNNDESVSLLLSVIMSVVMARCDRDPIGCLRNSESIRVFDWILNKLDDKCLSKFVKSHILDLLCFLSSYQTINEFDNRLEMILNIFRSEYFNLDPSSLQAHSGELTTYTVLFNKILYAMRITGSPILLRFVINLIVQYPKYGRIIDDANEAFSIYMKSLSKFRAPINMQLDALDIAYKIYNEDNNANKIIASVKHCLKPMLIAAQCEVVREFFLRNIKNLLDSMSQTFSTDPIKLERELPLKIGACMLLEVPFQFLEMFELEAPESQINRAAFGYQNTQIKLLSNVCNKLKIILRKKSLPVDVQQKKLYRQLRCEAFNAIMFIISEVKNESKFYRLPFEEAPQRGEFVWENIVDVNERYVFPMEFSKIPARKKHLIQKRKNTIEVFRTSWKCFPSSYLSESSLADDVAKFDFSNSYIRSENSTHEQNKEFENILTLEVNDLNEHECMKNLCVFVRLAASTSEKSQEYKSIPDWMNCIKLSYCNTNQLNVKLLITQLLLNCNDVFSPYAQFWLEPIMRSVVKNVYGEEMNNFLCDVIVMLLEWSKVYSPTSEEEKRLSSEIIQFLIPKLKSDRNSVFKYNMNLIEFLIEVWHRSFSFFPYELIQNQDARILFRLSRKLFQFEILPYSEETKISYLNAVFGHMKQIIDNDAKDQFPKIGFEIIGGILSRCTEAEIVEIDGQTENVINAVQNLFHRLNTKISEFLEYLMAIQIYYPEILKRYYSFILNKFSAMSSSGKMMILKIMKNGFRCMPDDILKDLMAVDFHFCLTDSDHDLLKCALEMIDISIDKIDDGNLAILFPYVEKLAKHSNKNCRLIVYQILKSANKFCEFTSSAVRREIMKKSKPILLHGIFDSDAELQEIVTQYWLNDLKLSSNIRERFVTIFERIYTPDTEHFFLNYASDLLIESISSTVKISDEPLAANSNFEDQKIITLWSSQSSSSILGLSGSVVNRLNAATQGHNEGTIFLRVRGTQRDFIFQPTIHESEEVSDFGSEESNNGAPYYPTLTSSLFSFSSKSSSSYVKHPRKNNTSMDDLMEDVDFRRNIRKLKQRIVRDSGETSENFAARNIKLNEQRHEFLKNRRFLKENRVSVYRSYRKGDFPDVEISYTSIIKPLQALVMRDDIMAEQVFVLLFGVFKGSVPKSSRKDYFQKINLLFIDILSNTKYFDNSLMSTLLSVAYKYSECIKLKPEHIMRVSQNSEQKSLGCLLLENSILDNIRNISISDDNSAESRSVKKIKLDNTSDLWISLAGLYHNLEQIDVVDGIFYKIDNAVSIRLQEALEQERNGKWTSAANLYKDIMDQSVFSSIHEECFAYESYFKCAAKLSEWDDINECVRKKYNLDFVFKESCHLDSILPWLFISETHRILESKCDPDGFLTSISSWMADDQRRLCLIEHVSAELSTLLLWSGDLESAKIVTNKRINEILSEWSNIKMTFDNCKYSKLIEVQLISEIDQVLDVMNDLKRNYSFGNVNDVFNIWKWNLPTKNDSILIWDKRTTYRTFFADSLINFQNQKMVLDEEEELKLSKLLTELKIKSWLALSDSAICQKNSSIAKKYIANCLEEEFYNTLDDSWKNVCTIYRSKLKLLYTTELCDTGLKKLDCLHQSWRILDDVKIVENGSSYEFYKQVSDLCVGLSNILFSYPELKTAEFFKLNIWPRIGIIGEENDIMNQLGIFTIEKLLETMKCSKRKKFLKQAASAHLLIVRYCEKYKKNQPLNFSDEQLYNIRIMRSTLQAMKFGSTEANQLFPTLLQLPNLDGPLSKIFHEEIQDIEDWKFLGWVNQLVANMDTKLVTVVEPLVRRLTDSYPQAIQIPILLSSATFAYQHPKYALTKNLLSELNEKLAKNGEGCLKLIEALSYVCLPKLPILSILSKIHAAVADKEFPKLRSLLKDLFQVCSSTEMKGELFVALDPIKKNINDICEKFLNNLLDSTKASEQLKIVSKQLDEKTKAYKYNSDRILESYNPWFKSFPTKGLNIEIPGQYTGCSKPLPKYHTRIFSFKDTVEVMHSVKKPIKITIIGNDGKEYSYLVKYGEDLRQDNRIQQLLSIMNHSLSIDPDCKIRKLSVATYVVVPLKTDLGLIQWITDTEILFQFFGLTKEQEAALNYTTQCHNRWLLKKCPRNVQEQVKGLNGLGRLFIINGEAVKCISRDDAINQFKNFSKCLPKYILRDKLLSLCQSTEMFLNLRSIFITSYSAMSLCHWILGIGDRHLENTLVCQKTGRCIGIDFGFAFGNATQYQCIPEMTPFRLTPHIEAVMDPFGVSGLIRETMIHCLTCLCRDYSILLSTMNVFIQEPSVDWENYAKRNPISETEKFSEHYDNKSHHERKIRWVSRKFEGVNPVTIFSDEIEHNMYFQTKSDFKIAYKKLLTGIPSDERNRLPSENLSASQQVDCLLDLAKDEHILAFSYCGHLPYI